MVAKSYQPLLALTMNSQSSLKYLKEIPVRTIPIQQATSGI
jgi:hypothetical protein